MTATPTGQAIAAMLWEAGAIRVSAQQPFILAAGWASPVYIDCRLLIGEPAWRSRTASLAADFIREKFPANSFDAIAGAETSGVPFAVWVADILGLKLRYVRKRSLGTGHNAQVEGGSVKGLRVLLMDDLTTDGGSKLAFMRGLEAAGAKVEHVLTIFHHDAFPGAQDRLAKTGLSLWALATWADLLAVDHGQTSDKDREEIMRFLADPVAWSTRHGGRSSPVAR
ncbi:MAG TPA: orotate phosphoribosyltransferase [Pseudolabrys sp.]|jgi:orotate phosphoribosyltransferase|nr:orotate phosphoribosyltransferase [Pseudolabrys sp.]